MSSLFFNELFKETAWYKWLVQTLWFLKFDCWSRPADDQFWSHRHTDTHTWLLDILPPDSRGWTLAFGSRSQHLDQTHTRSANPIMCELSYLNEIKFEVYALPNNDVLITLKKIANQLWRIHAFHEESAWYSGIPRIFLNSFDRTFRQHLVRPIPRFRPYAA